ncbi:MAG: DUF882 domain-containing protein [Nitrospiraceae bacterium]|nr:MAG: DUF882 domain-containing protein [Nitrospiraceae bacterium]
MKPSHSRSKVCSLHKVSRRRILKLGLLTMAAAFAPAKAIASLKETVPGKKLALYNAHTEEHLETVFWKNGAYQPEALAKINHLLRDVRSGEETEIHTELLDLLHALQKRLKCQEPFFIVSGYRTPLTNALLRQHKKGVAKNSLHMYGMAADLRLPGYSLRAVRETAITLQMGGVGYYPRSQFIHVDVGEPRYWYG